MTPEAQPTSQSTPEPPAVEPSKEENQDAVQVVEEAATKNDEADIEGEPTSSKSKQRHMTVAVDAPWSARMWEVFITFWPLGFVAFGGPQAHVAILRDHLVVQRDWLDEEAFTELFAIGQVCFVCVAHTMNV